jgi:hypothetical protein
LKNSTQRRCPENGESEAEVSDADKFFLGRAYDLKKKRTLDEPIYYDPDDLTTHGVVVGMTGSGKTGLCVDLLEEAALQGIPALLVDPKGDIANLLLHFPELAPEDFQPWMDADQARREETSVAELAAATAATWREGLKDWGIDAERIKQVRDAVNYAVFTPGSDAGLPVSILASLEAPPLDWGENEEILREKISSTVTALLGLVGVEADPVRSREHILLSNIFEHAWKDTQDLDLAALIQEIQNPPMKQLGAFEVDQFFPPEDRFELAMALNNLLASPSFQAWIEGTPLDIQRLLWTEDGRPRQSVFYLAHLPAAERMFFVTLLLASIEAWMHTQAGSPTLKALLYFDEVYGYLPPVANPPSKPPLLRLLKQARAFGLGVLLTTQNPVDLDYKALSNAGTWFIGKLQTEQDKARLLEGLEGVESGEAEFDRAQIDKTITALGKRVFLLHNVHELQPLVFYTRWAMAYLKGPITRAQIPRLNELVGAEVPSEPAGDPAAQSEAVEAPELAEAEVPTGGAATRIPPPAGVAESFLSNNRTEADALKEHTRDPGGVESQGLIYRPALLGQVAIRYLDRKLDLEHEQTFTALLEAIEPRGVIRWEDALVPAIPMERFENQPVARAVYGELGSPLNDAKWIRAAEKDFLDYVYHSAELRLEANSELKLVAPPGTTSADFRTMCAEAAKEARDAEAEKLRKKYEKKIERLEAKLAKEQRELEEDQAELSARKMEELATHAENVLGLFSGSRSSRRVSSSLTKRRMTSKAKADVEESLDTIEEFKSELAELEAELAEELDDLDDHWGDIAAEIEETVIKPKKKDLRLEFFGVAWFPRWQLLVGETSFELPGFTR